MKCHEIEPWISAYQDGELDPRRQARLTEHLSECTSCRELASALEELGQSLQCELTHVEAPVTLHTCVMAQIPEPEPAPVIALGPTKHRRGGWTLFAMAPFAAAAAWTLLVALPSAVMKLNTVHVQTAQETNPPVVEIKTPSNPKATDDPAGQVRAPKSVSSINPKSRQSTAATKRLKPAATPPDAERAHRRETIPSTTHRKRPRRKSYPVAHHYRPRWPLIVEAPLSHPGTGLGSAEPPVHHSTLASRIRVVDYVLPVAPTTEPRTEEGTEFVLRAAKPIEVAQTGFEY